MYVYPYIHDTKHTHTDTDTHRNTQTHTRKDTSGNEDAAHLTGAGQIRGVLPTVVGEQTRSLRISARDEDARHVVIVVVDRKMEGGVAVVVALPRTFGAVTHEDIDGVGQL
jgi:hypothetical protein